MVPPLNDLDHNPGRPKRRASRALSPEDRSLVATETRPLAAENVATASTSFAQNRNGRRRLDSAVPKEAPVSAAGQSNSPSNTLGGDLQSGRSDVQTNDIHHRQRHDARLTPRANGVPTQWRGSHYASPRVGIDREEHPLLFNEMFDEMPNSPCVVPRSSSESLLRTPVRPSSSAGVDRSESRNSLLNRRASRDASCSRPAARAARHEENVERSPLENGEAYLAARRAIKVASQSINVTSSTGNSPTAQGRIASRRSPLHLTSSRLSDEDGTHPTAIGGCSSYPLKRSRAPSDAVFPQHSVAVTTPRGNSLFGTIGPSDALERPASKRVKTASQSEEASDGDGSDSEDNGRSPQYSSEHGDDVDEESMAGGSSDEDKSGAVEVQPTSLTIVEQFPSQVATQQTTTAAEIGGIGGGGEAEKHTDEIDGSGSLEESLFNLATPNNSSSASSSPHQDFTNEMNDSVPEITLSEDHQSSLASGSSSLGLSAAAMNDSATTLEAPHPDSSSSMVEAGSDNIDDLPIQFNATGFIATAAIEWEQPNSDVLSVHSDASSVTVCALVGPDVSMWHAIPDVQAAFSLIEDEGVFLEEDDLPIFNAAVPNGVMLSNIEEDAQPPIMSSSSRASSVVASEAGVEAGDVNEGIHATANTQIFNDDFYWEEDETLIDEDFVWGDESEVDDEETQLQ